MNNALGSIKNKKIIKHGKGNLFLDLLSPYLIHSHAYSMQASFDVQ